MIMISLRMRKARPMTAQTAQTNAQAVRQNTTDQSDNVITMIPTTEILPVMTAISQH